MKNKWNTWLVILGVLILITGQMTYTVLCEVCHWDWRAAAPYYFTPLSICLGCVLFGVSFPMRCTATSVELIILSSLSELAMNNILDEFMGTPTMFETNEMIGFGIVLELLVLRLIGKKHGRTGLQQLIFMLQPILNSIIRTKQWKRLVKMKQTLKIALQKRRNSRDRY